MDRRIIRDRLLDAPAWARVALTVPDERWRERGAEALADAILAERRDDRDQLALPLA